MASNQFWVSLNFSLPMKVENNRGTTIGDICKTLKEKSYSGDKLNGIKSDDIFALSFNDMGDDDFVFDESNVIARHYFEKLDKKTLVNSIVANYDKPVLFIARKANGMKLRSGLVLSSV